MKVTETIELLDIIARSDKRRITDADIEAWDEALDGLTFEDCRAAVAEHFKHSEEWLKPARVRALVRGAQNDRQMRRPIAPNGCPLGPSCCEGPLIPKPADFDELAAVAREEARSRWFGEDGRHRSYRNAQAPA